MEESILIEVFKEFPPPTYTWDDRVIKYRERTPGYPKRDYDALTTRKSELVKRGALAGSKPQSAKGVTNQLLVAQPVSPKCDEPLRILLTIQRQHQESHRQQDTVEYGHSWLDDVWQSQDWQYSEEAMLTMYDETLLNLSCQPH